MPKQLWDANNYAGNDPSITIDLTQRAGQITLNQELPALHSNANNQLPAPLPISITGPGFGNLTVARNTAAGTAPFTIFTIDSGQTVAISGLTISNGRAGGGGGIDNSGTRNLSAVAVTNNVATGAGGGIVNELSATLTMYNTRVSGNEAQARDGGGILNLGTLTAQGMCRIDNNFANEDGGGLENSGTATISGTIIESNEGGGNGGGVANFDLFTMTGGTLEDNQAWWGAGFFNAGGNPTLTNVSIQLNLPLASGGGVYAWLGTVTLNGCTISNNYIVNGVGPGYSWRANGGTVNTPNCTITDVNNVVDPSPPAIP